MEQQLINLCEVGNLNGAQQLLQLHPEINISAQNYVMFQVACSNGHLLVAQWLFQMYVKQHIDMSVQIGRAFKMTCRYGKILVAQWLFEIYKERGHINNILDYTSLFRESCLSGYLELAKWLLKESPHDEPIDISADNEYLFIMSCYCGNLDVAQWLLEVSKEIGKEINISARNENAFRVSCETQAIHDCLKLPQWLQSLKPHLYVINYDEDGYYKNYHIRTKKEINWEKRKYALFLASECKEDNLLYRLPTDIAKMVIGYV